MHTGSPFVNQNGKINFIFPNDNQEQFHFNAYFCVEVVVGDQGYDKQILLWRSYIHTS